MQDSDFLQNGIDSDHPGVGNGRFRLQPKLATSLIDSSDVTALAAAAGYRSGHPAILITASGCCRCCCYRSTTGPGAHANHPRRSCSAGHGQQQQPGCDSQADAGAEICGVHAQVVYHCKRSNSTGESEDEEEHSRDEVGCAGTRAVTSPPSRPGPRWALRMEHKRLSRFELADGYQAGK